MWLTLVPRACYVLKVELLKIPIFGSLVRPAGMIPVDRDGGGAALRALMKEGARAAGEGVATNASAHASAGTNLFDLRSIMPIRLSERAGPRRERIDQRCGR